jgi:uncharacterized protein YbbC (DUF1343 family)
MKHSLLLLLFAAFLSCRSQITVSEIRKAATLRTGAQQTERYLDNLRDKRVGIVTNQTSLIDSKHLVDTLLSLGVRITRVFAPEHGFRGEAGAGETIKDGKDPKSGLPVLSLYGKTKKPTPEMLIDVDVLLFDIQDAGARFYTYISTLHYVLEAAGENGKEVVVLDRPNPNGHYIDGPIREEKYKSFVGMHPIPIVHGLTVGELAKMILGEGWVVKKPALTIVTCEGYSHRDFYSIPVRPSPNLPNDRAIALYPSLCWFEGTEVSVGRGTAYPFQVIGFPGCTVGNFAFTPLDIHGVAMDPPFENKPCTGLDLRGDVSSETGRYTQIELNWLLSMYKNHPEKTSFFHSNGFFDKLCGTAQLREMIEAGKSEQEIRAAWQPALEQYKSMRSNYLLYPDFD